MKLKNVASKIGLLSISLALLFTSTAYGLPVEQKRVLQSGSYYYNIEETLVCTPGSAGRTTVAPGSRVYVLGDSITVGAKTSLQTKLTEAGFVVAEIDADGGRAISSDTAPTGGVAAPTALEAVDADTSIIAGSGAIVVALGTNSGGEDLNVQIPELIRRIRSSNNSAPIFWVNLFYTSGSGPAARNQTITTQAAALNITVIDASTAGIELGADGTHPTAAGSASFAGLIVAGISSGLPSGPAGGGGTNIYDPISLTYPNFPDEAGTAAAITNYLKGKYASSPWHTIDSSFGTWLLRETKLRNINPMLILAIGKQENGFGTIGSATGHVKRYHNYFGIKGTTPIDIPGSDYAGFSSPTDALIFFIDKVKANTQGDNRRMYAPVVNFYDYLGIHQSGTIAYPGDPLDPNDVSGPGGRPDGNRQDGWDNSMQVYTSWDIHKNDGPPTNPIYRGDVYNPGIYFTNSINLINELLGTSLSTTPTRGATSGVAGSSCSAIGTGRGNVSVSGYSFPLAPQRKIPMGGLPCKQTTCHHDGTAAFDLFYEGVEGKDVYALIGGSIETVGNQDPGFCQSIQLKGSDGFYYWYGHLIGVTVVAGETVQAGQSMAKVATWATDHTCNGTSGRSHLHIDRGCSINGQPQPGGSKSCRDPAFVPFLQTLYDTLPV